MADNSKITAALQVYQSLCTAISNRDWTFDKDDEKLTVHFGVKGEDIPMRFILVVDAERQLIRLLSPMPFNMSEEKRIEGAMATCAASFSLNDGSFDYDISDGQIVFRLTATFEGSLIGEGLFQYMISISCAMVDKYNDKFMAIDKGLLSIEDFIAGEKS